MSLLLTYGAIVKSSGMKIASYSEKTLATELKVHFTPTLIFLNADGKKVFQMNGYRNPAAFKHVLNYVKDKQYLNIKLVDYVRQQNESLYTLKPHSQFKDVKDFSEIDGPLAIIFEDKSCADCDEFHQEVLMHNDVISELQKFTLVRLDAFSTEAVIDVDGNKTTAQDWAEAFKPRLSPWYCSIRWWKRNHTC